MLFLKQVVWNSLPKFKANILKYKSEKSVLGSWIPDVLSDASYVSAKMNSKYTIWLRMIKKDKDTKFLKIRSKIKLQYNILNVFFGLMMKLLFLC